MKRSLRVGALQLRAHDRAAFPSEYGRIEKRIVRLAAQTDLVVLPEGTIPGYVLGDDYADDGAVARAIDSLAAIAARTKTVIVAGAAISDRGVLYNAGLVIDRDGSVAGRADKVFLWHFDRRWFAPGERIAPIVTSVGTIGVLVCADGRMPGIAAALVDAGAEMLAMPTAWVSSGRTPGVLENPIADLLGPLRAYENGVPFVAANKCGVEREMVLYCGKSQIVSPDGAFAAIAGERDEEELLATVTLGEANPRRGPSLTMQERVPPSSGHIRVAVSAARLPCDIDERLRYLDAPDVVAPGEPQRLAALDAKVPVAVVDDATVNDPHGLPALRRIGYRVFVWNTRANAWTERLARARAGETRTYVITVDEAAGRAFVADPDYTVVCGTFGDYRIASCALDLAKTSQTLVVPGTDVAEGFERVHTLTRA